MPHEQRVARRAVHDDLPRLQQEAADYLTARGETAGAWLKLGAVARFWRNSLEEFHYRLSDPQMARLTIDTYSLVSPFIEPMDIDWDRLRAVLLHGRRLDPSGRASVASLLGKDWPTVRRRVESEIKRFRLAWERMPEGPTLVTAALVDVGRMFGTGWFGSPNWPALVAEYSRMLKLDSRDRERLLHRPQDLDDETWARIIRASYESKLVLEVP